MAKGNSTFNISLKLLDQNFKKGISGIQKQIRGLGNFIRGAFALGSITAFGRQMIQVATDFEDGMARVRAVSGATDDELKMMTAEAQKLGATTRYTATEAAGALENLTRNGMTARQATQALSGTLQLAQANAIGLAEAADIVSNTLNMFGLTAKDVTRVNDVLSSVASTTATNVSEIYAALVNAAPAAVTLGISIEETAAAVGALAQRGVKAEQAGTALRTALTKMVDPKIVAKMREMGVAVDEQAIKEEGLIGVVKRLKDANLSMADLVTIFSQRGAVGIQQLIGAYDELELELEITRNSAGKTAEMFEKGVGSTRAAIDTLKSTYEAFLLSLGQKTSGVVNGTIKLFTDLIKNFNSIGGTIANLASVVVPLFTKRVVTMFTTFSSGAKKAAVDAVALKAAMGDWITLIATAVTWIGTYFYTSWTKVSREVNKFNKELIDAERESANLRDKTNELINKLGPDTDKSTLAGVVDQLVKMYPDFKKQIMEAAAEAGKTGEWEKLKKVMEDVVDLQDRAMRNNILAEGLNNYTELIAQNMQRVAGNPGTIESQINTSIESAINRLYGEVDKSKVDSVWQAMARKMLQAQTKFEAFEELDKSLSNYGIELGKRVSANVPSTLEKFVDNWFNNKDVATASKYYQEYESNVAKLNEADRKAAEAQKAAEEAARKAEEEARKREEAARQAAANKEEERKKEEAAAKQLQDIEDELNRTLQNAKDDLDNHYMSFSDYLEKCAEAAKHAYEKFRDIKGVDVPNPYKDRRDTYNRAIDFNKGAASIKEARDKQQAKYKPSLKRQSSINNTEPFPFSYEEDWRDYAIYTDEAITATGLFTNSLSSLQSAFDTLSSSDATWIDRLSAAQRVLETMEDAILGVVKIIGDLGDTELLASKKEAIASALSRKNKKKDIAADTTKAVTGAAASQASIPYVGPILAVAAVAGILALIAASSQKFASGGIVKGNTKYGDKLLARVNAGEAILNQRQQKRLLDIADGRAGNGGQQVQFFISGKDLVGVIRNNNAAASRITGSKGM